MLKPIADKGLIELPSICTNSTHNAHIFYIKMNNYKDRNKLINWLKSLNIFAIFHYIPLHSSPAGKIFSKFIGDDIYTTKESNRILRLPLFYNLTLVDQRIIINSLLSYFS